MVDYLCTYNIQRFIELGDVVPFSKQHPASVEAMQFVADKGANYIHEIRGGLRAMHFIADVPNPVVDVVVGPERSHQVVRWER